MRKVQRVFLISGILTSTILLMPGLFSQAFGQIRIVNCDAPVQSRKRGIGVNTLSDTDFRALAPGVSWYYNWGATPLAKPADVTMDFLPMAWNGSSGFQTSISSYLAAGNRPWRVLALNEPNLKGQAFMTPSNSAVTFAQVKAICDPYSIPVIAPHMAIGSAVSDSITAVDPFGGTNYTYTYQEPFLNAFLYFCGSSRPAGMGTHSYGGYGEITWILGTMHTDYPTQSVWLTEFCHWGDTSDAAVLATLIPSVDFCERTPWLEGYAWFMSRINGDPYNSLLAGSGILTAAGQAYVQMPVHDTNVFYHVPGRLQAERYVALNQVNIAPTTDADGLADMVSAAASGSLDYNIHVDYAGNYLVNFRVAGATGQISVYKGGTLLGTANVTQTGWSTVTASIALSAGTQTLHVVLATNTQRLNWMEFASTLSAFEQWQMQYFACTNCPSAAPDADPFGKGMTNTNQFLAGLNPTNPTSLFRILSISPQNVDLAIAWTMGSGKTNALQTSSAAANGSYLTNGFNDVFTVTNTVGMTTNYLDLGATTNLPSRFYRVRLVP